MGILESIAGMFSRKMDEASDAVLTTEVNTLGMMMWLPDQVGTFAQELSARDFTVPFHGAVFDAIVAISETGIADPVSVWEAVQGHPEADTYGLSAIVEMIVIAEAKLGVTVH